MNRDEVKKEIAKILQAPFIWEKRKDWEKTYFLGEADKILSFLEKHGIVRAW